MLERVQEENQGANAGSPGKIAIKLVCICLRCYFDECAVEHRWIPQVSCYLYIGISCQGCSVQSIGAT